MEKISKINVTNITNWKHRILGKLRMKNVEIWSKFVDIDFLTIFSNYVIINITKAK